MLDSNSESHACQVKHSSSWPATFQYAFSIHHPDDLSTSLLSNPVVQIISFICTTYCPGYCNLVTNFPKVRKIQRKKKKTQTSQLQSLMKMQSLREKEGNRRSEEPSWRTSTSYFMVNTLYLHMTCLRTNLTTLKFLVFIHLKTYYNTKSTQTKQSLSALRTFLFYILSASPQKEKSSKHVHWTQVMQR